jgi:ATP-dependent Clp protease ATP-binding subunit ClpA
MFERYTEKARRTIFFARYEASRFGSLYIEAEYLLLGLLREDKALANGFLRSHAAVESIRKQIEDHTARRATVPTSMDLPLSHECKRVLIYGAEEAERLTTSISAPTTCCWAVARGGVFRCSIATRTRSHPGFGTGAGSAIGSPGCVGRACRPRPSRPVAC